MKRNLTNMPATIFLVFLLVLPARLNAIPAFARKYQISCQVCHSPVPRLKPFGEEFAGDGFRLTKYESPRYFIQTGDDKLSLFRELPVAIRFDGAATFNFGNQKSVDFGTPSGLKLLSAGELSNKLSYYFYFFMSEAGGIVGIEDAFLMYNNLFGTGINFYVGQFQACDPLYKRESRLTLEDVPILKVAPGNSSVSLEYERGIMFDYEIPKLKTQLVAEIVNGSGIGNAGEEFLFDKDKFKNFMGRISQPISKSISIGLFGYLGKEKINTPPALASVNSEIRMFGPDIKLNINEIFMVNLQYVIRTDMWAYIEADSIMTPDVKTQGGFAEFIFTPKGDKSKWYLTGLLNWVDSDISDLNCKSATLHAGYLLRRNVRLFSEFTWLQSEKEYGKLSMGIVSAF
jgi:hypothetical protein